MAQVVATMMPAYNFVVGLGGKSMGFKSVQGIARDCEIHTLKEGGLNDRVHLFVKPPSGEKTLQFEKGVYRGHGHPFYKPGQKLDDLLTVQAMDPAHKLARTWTFSGCIIKKWTVSPFNADQSATLVDHFEVAYEAFTVVDEVSE